MNHTHSQRGAVLFVAMVLLLLLSLLAVTATQVTSMQEKMASNFQLRTTAFGQAERNLTIAEDWISFKARNQNFLFPANRSEGYGFNGSTKDIEVGVASDDVGKQRASPVDSLCTEVDSNQKVFAAKFEDVVSGASLALGSPNDVLAIYGAVGVGVAGVCAGRASVSVVEQYFVP
jgi:hypothetical protein